jgi:hypothetical protein
MGCWHGHGPWHGCGGPGYWYDPGLRPDYDYEYGPRWRPRRPPGGEELADYLDELEDEVARVRAELGAMRRDREVKG